MHEYYEKNKKKYRKGMNGFLKLISKELESVTGKPYAELLEEIWNCYENDMLENFPYIGGDDVSGTRNLTGSYIFVAMGVVLKRYGVDMENIGHLMVQSYECYFMKMPWIAKKIAGKMFTNTKMLNKTIKKADIKNAANAAKYPGSFETKTQDPPEKGYDFSYHYLVCPLADFARNYGYEEFMPYLCNLDYVQFGILGVPLYREHTYFEDGDYCDFKLKLGGEIFDYWPPVFTQGKGFK